MARGRLPGYKGPVDELRVGAGFAGHRIEAVVGRGGMGVVYVAVHERLKQRRALKVIAPEYSRDPEFRRRFEREWEVASAIDHPHVITIFDAGEDDGQLYIAMRYVEGPDMRRLIAEQRRLQPDLTAEIVSQVASALDAAHRRGLVHRDIKPANVVIAEDGDGATTAYLTDFGLTKAVDTETSGVTRTGMFVGTLDYIAPEQLEGVVTPRVDIYALGCLTYHALTGHVPYPQATAPAKMWAHINTPPPELPGASPALAEAVARAMAKNPDDRFPSAGDFARALAGAGPSPARATPRAAAGAQRRAPRRRAARLRRPSRRHVHTAATLFVVLCVGIAAGLLLSRDGAVESARVPPIRFATRPFGALPKSTHTIGDGAIGLERTVRFVDAGDCAAVASYNRTSAANLPCSAKGGPTSPVTTNFTLRDYGRVGTAGFVNFQALSGPATYPMALNRARRFVPSTYSVRRNGVPGVRRFSPHADAIALKFVRSIRDRDCHAFFTSSDTGLLHEKAACAKILDGTYTRTRAELRVAREIDLFRLGGTTQLSFYGLRAGGVYRTITVQTYAGNTLVLSMFPYRGIRVAPS